MKTNTMIILQPFLFLFILFCSIFPLLTTCFNLNPIESSLLQTRLDKIKSSIKEEYCNTIINADDSSIIDTYIFPGAGGIDDLVIELNESIIGKGKKGKSCKIIDWVKHRGSVITAAYDGEAVGVAISDLILSNNKPTPDSIHFIGISVGAFCANAAATSVFLASTNNNNSSIEVKLTLLDPFCGRGIFGFNYGSINFGKFATTAIQILNTDDPVPTTNEPLPNCICFDVTEDPRRNDFIPPEGDTMHSWPVAYFSRHYYQNNIIEPTTTSAPLPPRGTVIKSTS